MKRVTLPSFVVLALLVLAPVVQASDASLKRALEPYKSRLTSDIAYLANFSTPSKSSASGVLRKLSKISSDLSGATRAATDNHGSTSTGRRARTDILSGLRDALIAEGDAHASAKAARGGNRSSAKRWARRERTDINYAIPLFERGGRLLHLFG